MVFVVSQSIFSSTKACATIPYDEKEPSSPRLLLGLLFVGVNFKVGDEVNADGDGIRCLADANNVVKDECTDVEFVGALAIISRILIVGLFPVDDEDDKRFICGIYDDNEPEVNGNDDNEEDNVGNDSGGRVLGGCSKLLSKE